MASRAFVVGAIAAGLALLGCGGGAEPPSMSPDASQGPERTTAFEARILAALAARGFPAQVLWGAADPALPFGRFGEDLRVALGVAWILELPGKHFVQEDCPIEIAGAVAELVLKAR